MDCYHNFQVADGKVRKEETLVAITHTDEWTKTLARSWKAIRLINGRWPHIQEQRAQMLLKIRPSAEMLQQMTSLSKLFVLIANLTICLIFNEFHYLPKGHTAFRLLQVDTLV